MSSSVLLDLDTHGPVLTTTAPAPITPPSDGWVLFSSSEPVGAVQAYFTDALGLVSGLGVERVDSTLFAVLVPGQGLIGGPAQLTIVADDLVGNRTVLPVDLFVQRAGTALRIEVEGRPSMAMEIHTRSSYELILEARPSVLLEVETAGG